MEKLYISRRFDRNPNLKIKFYGYSETVTSQPLEIEGKIVSAMICKNINTHNRLIKQGWRDCTKAYYKQLQKQNSPENKTKVVKNSGTAKKRGRPKAKRK